MKHPFSNDTQDHVEVHCPEAASSVVLICEHASSFIPDIYQNLGLDSECKKSHAAWDPGALPVAEGLSKNLDATLITSGISRLVYDCNRPPSAPDAMPSKSEKIIIPGNAELTQDERQSRVEQVYEPFRKSVAQVLQAKAAPVLVTVHSFTPVYHDEMRSVEIGILHDDDTRLADAMLDVAHKHTAADVRRNEPYGPEHGVTHTLKEHAIEAGFLNVMLEIRNDLIATQAQQQAMAHSLTLWIQDALERLNQSEAAQ